MKELTSLRLEHRSKLEFLMIEELLCQIEGFHLKLRYPITILNV
jgi:hypothetical protein